MGPRTDWFSKDAIQRLSSQLWRVTSQSNRVGIRLSGETPLERTNHQELPSEGTSVGAIQVPASGQPVLFLADHIGLSMALRAETALNLLPVESRRKPCASNRPWSNN